MTPTEEPHISTGQTLPTRLAVLVFTDIVGSTDLKDRLGTVAYASMLGRHNALFEGIAARVVGAEVVKHTGDGYMAAFATASTAVDFALTFQSAMRAESWTPEPLVTRCGIHTGQMMVMTMAGKADLIGLTADLTARVMSLAVGGQILMTREVFNDARQFMPNAMAPRPTDGPPLLEWMAHGRYVFKGIEEPLDVFEVGVPGVSPLLPPPGTDKASRAVAADEEDTLGWRPAVGLEVPDRPAWVLKRKLGAGGFGEVWLGEHRKLPRKRVFKFCFDADRLRSFKREITLFRLLQGALGERDDIARLHEVKLDRAPFFLESDFSPDGDLTDWAANRGGIDTVPLETRLDLVARTATAVAAAHSVGIIHKDIKPANILIDTTRDGRLQPVLCDFGIGVLADRSRLADLQITQAGFTQTMLTENESSRTGTRLYAPPESHLGRPFTTAGDVYALGVLLFQMTVADLGRPIGEGWQRDVGDELLRADIAAAIDADPARRIGSASELAQRINTLGERRAALAEAARVAAEAEATTRRAAELQRVAARRKKLLIAAGSLVLVMAVVVAVIIALASELRRQKLTAQANEVLAQKEKAAALKSKTEAVQARAVTSDQLKLLESIIASGRSGIQMTVLDAVSDAEKHLDERYESTDVRDNVRVALGRTLLELRQPERALAVLRRASPERLALNGKEDLTTAELYEALANCLDTIDPYRSAEEVFGYRTRALAIRRRLQPPEELAFFTNKLYESVHTAFSSSMGKGEDNFLLTLSPFLENRPLEELRAWSYANLEQAKYYFRNGQSDVMVAQFRTMLKQLLANPRTRRETPPGLAVLALYVLRRGDVAGAEVLGRIAVQLNIEVNGPDDVSMVDVKAILGKSLVRFKRDAGGIQFLQDAVAIARARLGPTNRATIIHTTELVESLNAFGRTAEAEQARTELLASAGGGEAGDKHRVQMLEELAINAIKDPPLQDAAVRRARRDADTAALLAEKYYKPDDAESLSTQIIRERTLQAARDYESARVLDEKILTIATAKTGRNAAFRGITLDRLGLALAGLGRYDEAIRSFDEAAEILETNGNEVDTLTGSVLHRAKAHMAAGRRRDAEAGYRDYLAKCQLYYGDENPVTFEAMTDLARHLALTPAGREEASDLFMKAARASSRALGENDQTAVRIRASASDAGLAVASPTNNVPSRPPLPSVR